ncbi:hypothetical protein WR25_10292 [Diploscapter pachys]|uniref:Uncharacterized protein n=1 Tax=Diploscapter pachys TaxID=2018661 RepID=A0A2A2JEF6_9BILA|nr:hypothetical protein WR25_10292 [Diploscapter pachys]
MSQNEYSSSQLSPTRKQRGQGNRGSGRGRGERRKATSPRNHSQQRQQDAQSLQLSSPQFDADTQLPASSSAIIPTSTSVNGSPSQNRDPTQLEDGLEECHRLVKQLQVDLSFEQTRNNDLELTLARRNTDLAEKEETLQEANRKAADVELQLMEAHEQIAALKQERFDVKFELKGTIAELEQNSEEYKESAAAERKRNELLVEEIVELRIALEDARQELNRHVEFAKTQFTFKEDRISRSVSEAMSQVNEQTEMTLNELKALSQQISSSSSRQAKPRASDSQTTMMKYLAGKLTETETQLQQREKELDEIKEERERTRRETEELTKQLREIKQDLEKADKDHQAQISKITMQRAEMRCDLLALQRDYNKLKDEKEHLEGASEQIKKLELERDTAQIQFAEVKTKLIAIQNELNKLKSDLEQSSGDKLAIQKLRTELKQLQDANSRILTNLIEVNSQCDTFKDQKRIAVDNWNRLRMELDEYKEKQREMVDELERLRRMERHYRAQAEQLQQMIINGIK